MPRPARGRHRSTVAGVLVALLAWAPLGAQGVQLPPSLEIRVPKPPAVATGTEGSFLTYELHLTNLGATPLTLKRVEVLDIGASHDVLLSLSDSALSRALARPGTPVPAAERDHLAGGTRAVVFLWVPVHTNHAPASVRTRVSVERGSGDSARVVEIDGPAVRVDRGIVHIGPPLRGGPWLAANGPSNTSGHRRAIVTIEGSPAIAQRFAIDWVRIGDDGTTHTGDAASNANYHAEGNDALAVADGRVVAVKDGIPENVPGANSRAVPITLETIGGNHVIIDIGKGHYAFYAHLKPGSPRVKVGDHVRRGQVVGLVGNTGNSTEPHLHFHVSDANSPLGSEGIPYAIDRFEVVGHCQGLSACEHTPPSVRHGEIPLANTLVRFP